MGHVAIGLFPKSKRFMQGGITLFKKIKQACLHSPPRALSPEIANVSSELRRQRSALRWSLLEALGALGNSSVE